MANAGKRLDIKNILSLGNDLLGVLKNSKDADGLMNTLKGAQMLNSSCQSDADDIQRLLEEYERKIHICKEKILKAEDEANFDSELEHLQHELDTKLQEERLLWTELRAINDELASFERQWQSVEEKKEVIKKREKKLRKAQDLLSMCASVTNIIPNIEDQAKISGYVVDRSKKKVKKFEFEKTESPVHVCDQLWKML